MHKTKKKLSHNDQLSLQVSQAREPGMADAADKAGVDMGIRHYLCWKQGQTQLSSIGYRCLVVGHDLSNSLMLKEYKEP